MKKILALVLIFTMVFALVTPALSTDDGFVGDEIEIDESSALGHIIVTGVNAVVVDSKHNGLTGNNARFDVTVELTFAVSRGDEITKTVTLNEMYFRNKNFYKLTETVDELHVGCYDVTITVTLETDDNNNQAVKFIGATATLDATNIESKQTTLVRGEYIEPTCTNDGYWILVCADCGCASDEIEIDEGSALGHIIVTEVSAVVVDSKHNGLTGSNARFDVTVELTFAVSRGDEITKTVTLNEMYFRNKNFYKLTETVDELHVGCYDVTVIVTLETDDNNQAVKFIGAAATFDATLDCDK